jgi:adenylate cyclase
MAEQWLVSIYNDQALSMYEECASPLELGRQDDREGERLFQVTPRGEGGSRIAIARHDEVKISRRTALLEPISPDQILVRNISANVSLGLEDGTQILPGEVQMAEVPVVLKFGFKVVRIQSAGPQASERAVQSLELPTNVHFGGGEDGSVFSKFDLQGTQALEMPGVADWLRSMIQVLQTAASDDDFFQKGAQAAVEVVRLDLGRVLTRDGGPWETVAYFSGSPEDPQRHSPPSQLVVSRVCEEKKACWFDPLRIDENRASLAGVSSVVAAPVLSRAGEVIAILYGERRLKSHLHAARPVSRLDAMLIELLAVGLSAGLARVEQERAALALLTKFEQFFSPKLARQLATRPELLTGQDQEITVLFCDIRAFSRITRNHGTAFTLDWTFDVLSTMSDCVLKHQGVLVDYIGDELMAMWGAPEAQSDHAELACRAALEMIGSLSSLNDRWQDQLNEPTIVGIGINTGLARVGNIGSRHKFKYGPLGDTVNMASRVQGAGKYFNSNLLITRSTFDRLGTGFQCRCLGWAQVVNIREPIQLFELCPPDRPHVCEICASYEEALAAFHAQEFRKAIAILGHLVSVHREDGPSVALLARAISCLSYDTGSFDPVFRLPDK